MGDENNLVIFTLLGSLGGIFLFFDGFRVFKKKRLIDNIPTSTIRGMSMGLVELSVTSTPQKTLVAPFSKEECVLYEYEIERYEKSGKNKRWVTVYSGDSLSESFVINDQTGRAVVNPTGAEIYLKNTYRYTSGLTNPLNEIQIEFLESSNISYSGLFIDKPFRFTEKIIRPNQKVYILGTASNYSPDETSLIKLEGNRLSEVLISKGAGNEMFIISDKSQKELANNLFWRILLEIFGGALLSIICFSYLIIKFKL